jgi:hypothetical protein
METRTPTLIDARRYAAIRLAQCAAKLREADDQLVALGKELNATPTGERGTAFETDGDLAVKRCAAVAWAYGEMRRAERDLENLDAALRGEAPDSTDEAIAARERTRTRLEGSS